MLQQVEDRICIEQLLGRAGLTERQRYVLDLRFGLSGDQLTLKDVASEEGVSIERIRQLEAVALRKLRLLCFRKGLMPRSYGPEPKQPLEPSPPKPEQPPTIDWEGDQIAVRCDGCSKLSPSLPRTDTETFNLIDIYKIKRLARSLDWFCSVETDYCPDCFRHNHP